MAACVLVWARTQVCLPDPGVGPHPCPAAARDRAETCPAKLAAAVLVCRAPTCAIPPPTGNHSPREASEINQPNSRLAANPECRALFQTCCCLRSERAKLLRKQPVSPLPVSASWGTRGTKSLIAPLSACFLTGWGVRTHTMFPGSFLHLTPADIAGRKLALALSCRWKLPACL